MTKSKVSPRFILISTIILLIVIFAIQNSANVQLQLYFWTINIPRVLLIVGSMFLGVIIGLLVPARKSKSEE